MFFDDLKVAIVCDWLTDFGGAEKVILSLHKLFPSAPIYTSIYGPKMKDYFENASVKTSFINSIPFVNRKHRLTLPLLPFAFEQFDLGRYDLVISSSHSCAKGVLTKPETLHISYCHNPMRYAWDDFHSYIKGYKLPIFVVNIIYRLLSKIRIWDKLSADRVDFFIANSTCVASRINKYYRRDSEVIHPPCELENFKISLKKEDYYLAVGRLIPYKKFDLLVDAANQHGFRLKIVGSGFEMKALRKKAGKNIEFLSWVSEQDLITLYQKAKGFLFPQLEDFGITAIEAMACGTPVIAYKAGGALDTLIDGKTGVFFENQTVESLIAAIKRFENLKFDPVVLRKQAEKFSEKFFQDKILKFVENKLAVY